MRPTSLLLSTLVGLSTAVFGLATLSTAHGGRGTA